MILALEMGIKRNWLGTAILATWCAFNFVHPYLPILGPFLRRYNDWSGDLLLSIVGEIGPLYICSFVPALVYVPQPDSLFIWYGVLNNCSRLFTLALTVHAYLTRTRAIVPLVCVAVNFTFLSAMANPEGSIGFLCPLTKSSIKGVEDKSVRKRNWVASAAFAGAALLFYIPVAMKSAFVTLHFWRAFVFLFPILVFAVPRDVPWWVTAVNVLVTIVSFLAILRIVSMQLIYQTLVFKAAMIISTLSLATGIVLRFIPALEKHVCPVYFEPCENGIEKEDQPAV